MHLSVSGRPDHRFGRKGLVTVGFGPGSKASVTDIAFGDKTGIVAGPVRSRHLNSGQGFALARYRLGD
jgi:hypothetical protein